MSIPLNELSAIYNQSIAEGCGCEDKKKEKKVTLMPQGDSADGGDSAKPGKNKNYVKPMTTESHCEVDDVPCSPVEKKKEKKKVKEDYSDWRTDLREVVSVDDAPETSDTDASDQIKEKKIKNKIRINPPQGVTEGFEELGAVVVEMYELKEDGEEVQNEEMSIDDQMKVSQEYFKKRAARSSEEKEAEKKKNTVDRIKNMATHKRPDPYKARAGESD